MHNIVDGVKLPIPVRDSGRTHLFRNVPFIRRLCFHRPNTEFLVSLTTLYFPGVNKTVLDPNFTLVSIHETDEISFTFDCPSPIQEFVFEEEFVQTTEVVSSEVVVALWGSMGSPSCVGQSLGFSHDWPFSWGLTVDSRSIFLFGTYPPSIYTIWRTGNEQVILLNLIKACQEISMKWLKVFLYGEGKLELAHVEERESRMLFL